MIVPWFIKVQGCEVIADQRTFFQLKLVAGK